MLSKIMIAAPVAILAASTAPAAAQGYPNGYDYRYGAYSHGANGSVLYTDRYGLGYSNSARHDPRDTNGF